MFRDESRTRRCPDRSGIGIVAFSNDFPKYHCLLPYAKFNRNRYKVLHNRDERWAVREEFSCTKRMQRETRALIYYYRDVYACGERKIRFLTYSGKIGKDENTDRGEGNGGVVRTVSFFFFFLYRLTVSAFSSCLRYKTKRAIKPSCKTILHILCSLSIVLKCNNFFAIHARFITMFSLLFVFFCIRIHTQRIFSRVLKN